jgi:putative methylase
MTPTRRRSELVRAIEAVPPFAAGRPELEQVATPAEAAAELLATALERGDLADRTVIDLGAGTGRLAIGAALWGARSVRAIELDRRAAAVGRSASAAAGVEVEWVVADVAVAVGTADTVVMNPPFGAQRRGADRPFWAAAQRLAASAVYAFALADSRTFIAERAVERPAYVDATRPVAWELGRLFPHHRKDRVPIAVDLWVIRKRPR